MLSLAVLLFAAVIYSCSKQDQTEPAGSATEISQSDADILTENKIKAFKGKMEFLRENPSYKSGETMSVDSAVWYMEAASNQTYGDGASASCKSISDTIVIIIDAANNEVLLSDVVEAYDEMINNLSQTYHALPGDNYHLVVNDVSLTNLDESTATLGVNAVFGEGTDGTDAMFDYPWYYGDLAGRCDGSGLGLGSDAAEEIEKVIMRRKGTNPPGTYYTSVDSIQIYCDNYPNPNDPNPWDNYYDYLMFHNYEGWANYHTCVSVDELYFHLTGTEEVIYNIERPVGQSFISVNLIGTSIQSIPGSVIHYGYVKYGIKHTGGGGIEL